MQVLQELKCGPLLQSSYETLHDRGCEVYPGGSGPCRAVRSHVDLQLELYLLVSRMVGQLRLKEQSEEAQ